MPDSRYIYRPYATISLAKALGELSVIEVRENEFTVYHLNTPLATVPSLQAAFPIIEKKLNSLTHIYLACGEHLVFKSKGNTNGRDEPTFIRHSTEATDIDD